MRGKPINIPVRAATAPIDMPPLPEGTNTACEDGAPYALMVLGDAMLPEFEEGEVIVVEPDALVRDGSFVVAQAAGELYFRQLAITPDGWRLRALDPSYPELPIAGPADLRGVVIQKKKPGRRRAFKSYV